MKITLPELYAAYRGAKGSRDVARKLFAQSDWFCTTAEFDPKTGHALPQSLSSFLAKSAKYAPPNQGQVVRDRLWRITEHSRASVERLFRALNESPRREQALLPIHAVRELDANSFIKLSTRQGRNIREKLAGKPYLQAVRRFQSVNLPENRLLKAFVMHLAELLELRTECLGQEDALLPKIQVWLRSSEAQDITRWENLPPNNTLLSHRDYRRVWDAWRWLQSLDDDLTRDLAQLDSRDKTVRLWNQYAHMWTDGDYRFADTPILFDYEKFEIRPWLSKVPTHQAPRKFKRSVGVKDIAEPVCVDFTMLRPRYAASAAAQSLPGAFLWQQWRNEDEALDIDLYDADAACIHPEATTISSSDLFFCKDNTAEHFDRAARTFASRLRGIFTNDTLVWLVPDSLNDFELDVARRNLNARFPDAKPLPRSVAAAFERVDYSKLRDGFPIVVVDTIGGKTCITKLFARFDPELKNRLPETGGFYWERQPPIITASTVAGSTIETGYDILTVDDGGHWRDPSPPVKPQPIEPLALKRDARIGQFAFAINLTESPVSGGIRLHGLQQRAGDLPLWRDQIPELSIKVMKDGRLQRFHLVTRGTTVKPIRGRPVTIDVNDYFTLPAGRQCYLFPLFLGERGDDLGFSARLDSPAFPLKEHVVCRLDLTFEYGADDPYKLVFTPLDGSFQRVHATWRRTEDVIVTDAPAPEYPAPMTWVDLQSVPKQNSTETSDLLEWVHNALARLDQEFYVRPKPRTAGVISGKWRTDKNGKAYTYATCGSLTKPVFIHENGFVHGLNYAEFVEGTSVSFELQERDGKYSGGKVAGPSHREAERLKEFNDESTRNVVAKIRNRLYFPVIQVWRDGRSISDLGCPKEFADAIRTHIGYLIALLRESAVPESVKNELLFLMSCMHKDAPNECVQWITAQVESGNIRHPRAVGFALGDVSATWQEHILSELMKHPAQGTLRIFAYMIWREQHFVEKFDLDQLNKVLNGLNMMLGQVRPCPPAKNEQDTWTASSWIRPIAESLELLLGLLRTRNSSGNEIRTLLQPHQKIIKELVKQVERVTELVAQSNVVLFSRLQINIRKPDGDCTPDLLYALRLYLTGDDGANAIHITSVSDNGDTSGG